MPSRRSKQAPVEVLARAARDLLRRDLERARRGCDRVLERFPDRTDALELRCLVALEEADHQTALELIDRTLSQEETAKRHVARAKALIGLDRLDEAGDALSKAIRIDPEDPTSYEVEAALRAARGELEASLHAARGAVALAPERVRARGLVAAALRALGQDEPALEAYRDAVRARDGSVQERVGVMTEMVDLLELRGESDEAATLRSLMARLEADL